MGSTDSQLSVYWHCQLFPFLGSIIFSVSTLNTNLGQHMQILEGRREGQEKRRLFSNLPNSVYFLSYKEALK